MRFAALHTRDWLDLFYFFFI